MLVKAEGVHNISFTANTIRDAESEEDHEDLKYLSGSLRKPFSASTKLSVLILFVFQLQDP